MSNPYVKSRTSNLSRSYHPNTGVSPNMGYSWYQDDSQMTAQDLYRSNSIGKLLIDSYARFVIGKGLTPMASPETKLLKWKDKQIAKFQEQSEAYWRIMTDANIDFYNKNGILELEKIGFKDICLNGDTLLHLGYRTIKDGLQELIVPFVQNISGRMVSNGVNLDTKDCIGGVVFERGREVGYRIRVLDNTFCDTGQTRVVRRYNAQGRLAFNLIQLGQSDPSIVRGVPLLTTLRDDVLDINRFKDNHLMQSVIQNLFTAFIKHDEPASVPMSEKLKEVGKVGGGDKYQETDESDIFLATGNIIDLEVGEDVTFTPRSTSNIDYQEGLKANIGLVASALGMSYETAMNTYNASFSASRAGISGTEKNAEIVRLEYIRKFCQPIWEQVTEHGILSGMIEAPGYDGSLFARRTMLASTWTGITPPTVDLTKEVAAYASAVEAGLCSKEFAIRMLFGMDFDEVDERVNKEQKETSEKNEDEDKDSNEKEDSEDEQ